MKYIGKFGGGGFISFTPFIGQSPQPTETSTESSKEKPDEDSGVMNEKIYKELIGKGLVSDVNDFAAKMNALQNDYFGASNLFGSKPMTNYLSQIAKVNELYQNKQAWDNAVSTSEKTGGYGEVAIGTSNEVYTRGGDGRIKAISLEEFKEKRDKTKLLTVSELLNARNFEGQLANQNGIFNVANNSVGLSQINKKILDIVNGLGKESNNIERHYDKTQAMGEMARLMGIKKPTTEEATALKTLQEIVNTPGESIQVVNKNTTQKRHLDTALKYIWTTLGKNEQQKLFVSSVMNGNDNPLELISKFLDSQTDAEMTSEISGKELKNPDGSTSSTSDSKNMKSLTSFQMFHKDKLTTYTNDFALNDPKTNMLFKGVVGGISPILTPDGESVGMTTVKNILEKGNYNQFLKSNAVYFGNQKVEPGNMNNLIYNGEDAAKVYMPVGIGGSPDFEALLKFKDIYAVYEANKNSWTTSQAKEHFKKYKYNLDFDERYENGKKIKVIRDNTYVKPFLVMYGYTNDATGLTKNNSWITEFNSADESLIPQLESVWTIGEGKKAVNLTPKNRIFSEDYYKGIITIPYKENAAAIIDSMVGQGPKDRVSTLLDVQRNLNFSSNQPLNTNNGSLSLK